MGGDQGRWFNFLLAMIVAFLGAIGSMQWALYSNLYEKIDRVFKVFTEEKNTLRSDIKDVQKMVICTDQTVLQLREQIKHHLEIYEKERLDHKLDHQNNIQLKGK